MMLAKIKDVVKLTMGQSPSSDSYNENGEGIPFFQGKTDFGKLMPKIRMYCSNPSKLSNVNDILISVRAPVGDVNICNVKCCIGRGLAALTTKERILDYKYLYYVLNYKKQEINDMGTGSTFKAINKSILEEIEIPIHKLEIQQKIVNVLDKAQELIDKRKEQIEACDELIKSLFYHMFGDPVQNNKNLPKLQLKEIGDWKTGGTPVRSKLEYYKGNIPWLSSGELNSIYTKDSIEHITEQAIAQSAAKLISKRSLLLGMYDTAALKSTINLVECTCNQAIAFAKLFDDKVSTIFVYFCIQIGKEFYKSQQRGVRQKNLNLYD